MSARRMWAFDPDADAYDWEHPREGVTPDELWDEDDDDPEADTLPDPRCTVCGYPAPADRALCDDCAGLEALSYIPLKEVMQFRPDDEDP